MTGAPVIAPVLAGLAALLLYSHGAARRHRKMRDRFVLLLKDLPGVPADAAAEDAFMPAMLRARLHRAGIAVSPRGCAAAGFALLLLAVAAGRIAGPVAGLAAGALAVLAAWLVLNHRAAVRLRRLSDAMPGFLERLRQALGVGNSLAGALARAVETAPPVVADCFAPALRRIAHGGGVAESLERRAAELDLYELHLLATAARTHLRFGGSLTAILRGMTETIRRRASVERQLRADTTQTRASAWVLALLPLLVAALVMLSNRAYARWFLETGAGHRMIVFCVVFQLAGAWCMRRIARARY